jgi:phage terminase large subunit-like protein
MVLAGRGFGKTRTGAEWVRSKTLKHPGCHIALVAPTAADVRDVMVQAIITPWKGGALHEVPQYEPSKRSVRWANGSRATTYSADEPERLRGPAHAFAWGDELCSWRYPDAWDQLQFGLREGSGACALVTTTPKPTPLLKRILKTPTTVITKGSTFDNAANLDESAIDDIKRQYEGTRLGRQEIYAEILDDVPGALWTVGMLESGRVDACPVELRRVVVAVDPSGGDKETNDEQGIVVVALGTNGHGYVLEDCTCKLTPDGWGKVAVRAYQRHSADRIVFEKNFGGAMVEHVIAMAAKDLRIKVTTKEVQASRGKVVRAEPVAALYEQNRVHHVGYFKELEDQMCHFTPTGEFEESPDRADALVWALTELMLGEPRAAFGDVPFRAPAFTFSGDSYNPDDED